jgi:predicted  nucleic acid-binding Zn-ribbon protein
VNLPARPRVLSDADCSRIYSSTIEGNTINEKITGLQSEYDLLRQLKPRVLDNFDALDAELSETESAILLMESDLRIINIQLTRENDVIIRLTKDLEIINSDIRNNNDAARLQKFGSEATGEFSADICPVCKQAIHDTLLSAETDNLFMSIEDNIRHLKEQKSMLEFSLSSHRKNKEVMQQQKITMESRLITLRRLAHTLRSDLFTTTDTEASEAIMLKCIEISRCIENLTQLNDFVSQQIDRLKELASQWNLSLIRNTYLQKAFPI